MSRLKIELFFIFPHSIFGTHSRPSQDLNALCRMAVLSFGAPRQKCLYVIDKDAALSMRKASALPRPPFAFFRRTRLQSLARLKILHILTNILLQKFFIYFPSYAVNVKRAQNAFMRGGASGKTVCAETIWARRGRARRRQSGRTRSHSHAAGKRGCQKKA